MGARVRKFPGMESNRAYAYQGGDTGVYRR